MHDKLQQISTAVKRTDGPTPTSQATRDSLQHTLSGRTTRRPACLRQTRTPSGARCPWPARACGAAHAPAARAARPQRGGALCTRVRGARQGGRARGGRAPAAHCELGSYLLLRLNVGSPFASGFLRHGRRAHTPAATRRRARLQASHEAHSAGKKRRLEAVSRLPSVNRLSEETRRCEATQLCTPAAAHGAALPDALLAKRHKSTSTSFVAERWNA
jgi:hypothetical protein